MKRFIAAITALAALGCMMTACGKSDDSSSSGGASTTAAATGSTSASTEEDTTSEDASGNSTQEKTTETTTEKGTAEQYSTEPNDIIDPIDAKEVTDAPYMDDLKNMIECLNNADFERYLHYMLPDKLLEIAAEKNGASLEDMAKEMEKSFNSGDDNSKNFPIKLGKVVEAEGDTEDLDEMAALLADMAEDLSDDKVEELGFDPAEYFGKLSEIHYIAVEMTSATGETEVQDFIAYKFGDEGWKFDLSMLTYVKKSKQTSMNAAASSLSKAATAALADMDAKGDDISGKFIISSDPSLDYNVPAKTDTDAIRKAIINYFDKADEMNYFVVCDNGTCNYAVIQKDGEKYIGIYPADKIYNAESASYDSYNSQSFDELYEVCKSHIK